MNLHHIGFVSRDISKTFQIFKEIFGAEMISGPFLDKIQQVNEILVNVGDKTIQIFEPISEKSPAYNFLKKKGEGLHHLCYEVSDIEKTLERFRNKGIAILFEPFQAFEGRRAAFISPFDTSNLLVELVEKPTSK